MSEFDAAARTIKVGRADYLRVEDRLLWFRSDHPDGEILTDVVEVTAKRAVFRCRVIIPGGGSGSGYGSETPADYGDYVEKAETKAIGRALATAGYGTQFVDGAGIPAVASQRSSTVRPRVNQGNQSPADDSAPSGDSGASERMSGRQVAAIDRVSRFLNWDDARILAEVRVLFPEFPADAGWSDMTAGQAMQMIPRIQGIQRQLVASVP
jgi:hypothetical protein